ncbi:MAG: ATP-binding cassette domain-containing protein [Filifactoraceae bacterium]
MIKIEIHSLNKEIKGIEILKNINLNLESGKIYGFYGRNGSGKTMLFRAISGLIKPTNGYIKIDNKVLHEEISIPPDIGILLETPGFWENYTGFENLKTLSRIKKIIGNNEIRVAMKSVGLDPDDKRSYKKYSLGMKQKLGIAQAIMENPNILILDEPTNALDEESIEKVRDILIKEKKRGTLILIASHNKEDIDGLCDCKYKMVNGEISNEY